MRSEKQYFEFKRYENEDLESFFSSRDKETKIAQSLCVLEEAKFIILGIKESVGPRANLGRDGAENGFDAFLSHFLNMQSNESLKGDDIHVLGNIEVVEENESNLREMVSDLDGLVHTVLKTYIGENQIPIVIGGGHNNAYPLIKFSFERFGKEMNVVNLDAHADYRPLEGRHSGNSFSYAFQDGFIKKYYVLGLHQRYNSQRILDDLRRDSHYSSFHEDYLMGLRDYKSDFQQIKDDLRDERTPLGLEMDLDAIENMPSSAFSPIGISAATSRLYIRILSEVDTIAYVHLPEAAPKTDKEKRIVGKMLAYLVSDFIETH